MNCKSCGKVTSKWGNRYKKYCSIICQRTYEADSARFPVVQKSCLICSKEFNTTKPKVHKYCSKPCKQKADLLKRSNKPIFKICKHCKKEFTPYTSLDKFCCANCRIESGKSKRTRRWKPEKAAKRIGKMNPAYRHGLSVRGAKIDSTGMKLFQRNREQYLNEIIDNHGYLFCERCFKSNARFHVHHIIYRSEKPKHDHIHDKINFINVCVPCHNWFHNKKSNRNDLVRHRGLDKIFGNDVLDKGFVK